MRASLLVLAGCLHGRPGVDQWHAISTAHFEMWTDGDVATAKETLTSFEHARSVILGVLAPELDSHRRTLVLAFADRWETAPYLPKDAAAQTLSRTPLLAPVIIMAADATRLDERVLVHELAHAVSFEFMPHQPDWFAEGLASYFEGIQLEGKDVEVGRPSPDRAAWLRHRLTVEQAMHVRRSDRLTPQFYATTWVIVAYLINARRAAFDAYEAKLRHGDAAWTEVPVAELQQGIDDWVRRNELTYQRYVLQVRAWPATVRALPPADVLAIEGLFAHDGSGKDKLATARALEPTNLIAELARNKPPAIEAARAVAAAHPDDWRAHWMLMLVATGDERDAAWDRTCALLGAGDDPPEQLQCPR